MLNNSNLNKEYIKNNNLDCKEEKLYLIKYLKIDKIDLFNFENIPLIRSIKKMYNGGY